MYASGTIGNSPEVFPIYRAGKGVFTLNIAEEGPVRNKSGRSLTKLSEFTTTLKNIVFK